MGGAGHLVHHHLGSSKGGQSGEGGVYLLKLHSDEGQLRSIHLFFDLNPGESLRLPVQSDHDR